MNPWQKQAVELVGEAMQAAVVEANARMLQWETLPVESWGQHVLRIRVKGGDWLELHTDYIGRLKLMIAKLEKVGFTEAK